MERFTIVGSQVRAKDAQDFDRLVEITDEHGLFGWSRCYDCGKHQNALIFHDPSICHAGYEAWVQRAHDLGILRVDEGEMTAVLGFMQKTHDLLEELGY